MMQQYRANELALKHKSGTLTDAESEELEVLTRWYHTCPVCGGAFYTLAESAAGDCCPQCDTPLRCHAFDRTGHRDCEIDDSIDPYEHLGVFCVAYTSPATRCCCLCGTVYPKNYSCCPSLLGTAIRFHRSGTTARRQAAIDFVDEHSESLVNSLRGRFGDRLDKRDRKHLVKRMVPLLSCGDAIRSILVQ